MNPWWDIVWVSFRQHAFSAVMGKSQSEQWIRRKHMEYQATAKYLRISTRKLRLVADSIRPLSPSAAITKLMNMPKQAAGPLADVIRSTLANAKQKQAKEEALHFKTIEIMGGPVLKRWHAVSRGQAHAYKKRMTHVRIVLTDEKAKR